MHDTAIVFAIVIALASLAAVILYYGARRPAPEPLPVWTDQFTRTAVDLGDPAELDLDTPNGPRRSPSPTGSITRRARSPCSVDAPSHPAAGLSGNVTTDRG